MMNSAVLQKLTVIGEAASRLPKEFTNRFPEIPWVDIIGFRNIAVHEYFAIPLGHCLGCGNRGSLCVERTG
jgi:uncharacterized protein with HEPN domain